MKRLFDACGQIAPVERLYPGHGRERNTQGVTVAARAMTHAGKRGCRPRGIGKGK